MTGAIYPGALVERDLHLDADVCIAGSGPGGSVLAAELCARGLRVVMLEEGGYHTRHDYSMREGLAYPMLYQDQGLRSTEDAGITILQGRTVGGGSVVNWTTSFRTPQKTLDTWARVHGIEGIDAGTLGPHWDAVEKRLEIHAQPADQHNPQNAILLRGARALGFDAQPTRRNVNARCINSGYCSMGCPVDGKNDMVVTYLPDAVANGLRLFANARVESIELEGKRVSQLTARILDPRTHRPRGPTLRVKAKIFALACGALNTPALLLRSHLDWNGLTGKRTFLHPVCALAAEYDQPIEGYYGAPQSAASHHFIERGDDEYGFFIETAPIHPMLAAGSNRTFGSELEAFMARLPNIGVLIGLARDGFVPGDDGGEVRVDSEGRMIVQYPFRPKLRSAFREAMKVMARMHFAAGAKRVASLGGGGLVLQSPSEIEKLEALGFAPATQPVFSAHQMGGCAMGGDPARSVVDSKFRHRAAENLFVVDGSVFPTSLGVNPQLTIYGMARLASTFVATAI